MVLLLRGQRAQDALEKANQALEHGEAIAVRLNQSLSLLRSSRDELAAKMRNDTELAISHQRAAPEITLPAQPAPSLRQWIFLEQSRASYQAQRAAPVAVSHVE